MLICNALIRSDETQIHKLWSASFHENVPALEHLLGREDRLKVYSLVSNIM